MRPDILDRQRMLNREGLSRHFDAVAPEAQKGPENTASGSSVNPRRRQRLSIPGPSEGWISLVLLAIALYCVITAIVAAGRVQNPADSKDLFYTPFAGLLLGLLVSKLPRLPQSLLHLASCLVGVFLSLWLTGVVYHQSAFVTLHDLQMVFSGSANNISTSSSQTIFFFYLAFLCFFLGYFGSWLIYRARLPWLIGLVYCSILLVNLNDVDFRKQDLTYLIVIMLGALVLLIARLNIVNQIAQWRSEGLYADRSWINTVTWRCMQVACVVTLLVLVLSSLSPVEPQPQAGKQIWSVLDNAWSHVANGDLPLQRLSALTQPYQPSVNFFGDQLTISGNVQLPTGEVLDYVSSDHQSHYLESYMFNSFDGHNWTVSPDTAQQSSFSSNSALPQDFGQSGVSTITTRVLVLQPPSGTRTYLFAPDEPMSFNAATAITSDGDSVTSWSKIGSIAPDSTYDVISSLPDTNPHTLSQDPLPDNNPDFWLSDNYYVSHRTDYLEIPGDLSAQEKKLPQSWTSGAQNAYQALLDLQNHLRDTSVFTYSIENAPIPDNEDVVDVLLQTKTGYCTYYATAMAVMARQLHIPTRIVSGFNGGTYQSQTNTWSVMGSDAHSWVQAYLPGHGWVTFDPTPSAGTQKTSQATPSPTSATPAAQAAPHNVATPTARPAHATAQSTQNATHTQTTSTHTSAAQANEKTTYASLFGSAPFWLVTLLIVMSCICVFLMSWLTLLIVHERRFKSGRVSVVSSVYTRLCRLAWWVGLGPRQWQTPYEYCTMLASRLPEHASVLWILTDLFVRERWSPSQHGVSNSDEQIVQHAWPGIRRSLLATLWNRHASHNSAI